MGKTFIFTTDNANICLIAVGKDQTEAKATAEQALQARPGVKLAGLQEINHSVIIGLDVTILTKSSSDDILIRKIIKHFEDRARIELRNDIHEDGSIAKRFLVNGEHALTLNLKNAEQAEDFQANGLGDKHFNALVASLESFVKKHEPEVNPLD